MSAFSPALGELPRSLCVLEQPGRGRCLLTAAPVAAGEVILAAEPCCWWVDAEHHHHVCARCLGLVEESAAARAEYEECGACWCSVTCRSEDAERHAAVGPLLRHEPRSDGGVLSDAAACTSNLLHFVAHALALRRSDPAAFGGVLGLHSEGVELDADETDACAEVARLVSTHAAELAAEQGEALVALITALCKKDKASDFGLAMPPVPVDDDEDDSDDSDEPEGGGGMVERRLRGYACYPPLAFANHSCLPSAARFDALDGQEVPPPPAAACTPKLAAAVAAVDGAASPPLSRPPHSLATRLVALHALPAGSEVTISYLPLGEPLHTRRAYLRREYCFGCDCARCVLEEHDEADAEAEAEAEAAGECACCPPPPAQGAEGEVDGTYISLYVLKHVCGECMGTMAPFSGGEAAACVCNRCGAVRTEAEFMERVREHFEGGEEESTSSDSE